MPGLPSWHIVLSFGMLRIYVSTKSTRNTGCFFICLWFSSGACGGKRGRRQRTAELIRPILRGRDIKRYGYNWANLWLINTHNGIKGKLDRIHIEDYPAVKAHLDQYWDKISKRADKGETPYNLRNCAYLEDFSKPKLFYADITQNLNFVFCEEYMFCNNTTYFIASIQTERLQYIAHFLNSKLIDWYYRTLSVQLGANAVRMFSIYVLEIPIPHGNETDVYKAYGLSQEEISYIETQSN
jgi:hypothetical protein